MLCGLQALLRLQASNVVCCRCGERHCTTTGRACGVCLPSPPGCEARFCVVARGLKGTPWASRWLPFAKDEAWTSKPHPASVLMSLAPVFSAAHQKSAIARASPANLVGDDAITSLIRRGTSLPTKRCHRNSWWLLSQPPISLRAHTRCFQAP